MKLNKLIRIGDIVIHEFLYAELVEDIDLRSRLEEELVHLREVLNTCFPSDCVVYRDLEKPKDFRNYHLARMAVPDSCAEIFYDSVDRYYKLETRLMNKGYSTLVRFHFSNGTFKDSFWFGTYAEAWGYLESLFDKEV